MSLTHEDSVPDSRVLKCDWDEYTHLPPTRSGLLWTNVASDLLGTFRFCRVARVPKGSYGASVGEPRASHVRWECLHFKLISPEETQPGRLLIVGVLEFAECHVLCNRRILSRSSPPWLGTPEQREAICVPVLMCRGCGAHGFLLVWKDAPSSLFPFKV